MTDDSTLYLLAETLDELEHARIATNNRLDALTRTGPDKNGTEVVGLPDTHPSVVITAEVLANLQRLEHEATLNLQRAVRKHPLGGWIRGTIGVGEKQGARLLAAIGDPYWNTLHDRPRTVSELWAYCGLHVLRTGGHSAPDSQSRSVAGAAQAPASQVPSETHGANAGGPTLPGDQGAADAQWVSIAGSKTATDHALRDTQDTNVGGVDSGDPSQAMDGTQSASAGVAAKRRKGQKANWSNTAKMRAYLIAESCQIQRRSPYREVYDKGRAKYLLSTHAWPCAQCGPAGKPAQVGSELSAGHQHARALRLVAKAVLKDLWIAAREHHTQEQPPSPSSSTPPIVRSAGAA